MNRQELREKIIATGDKGTSRAIIATHADQILHLIDEYVENIIGYTPKLRNGATASEVRRKEIEDDLIHIQRRRAGIGEKECLTL